ncbi:hypothetical protein [Modestobacter sp. SSW1-42]|uniref:hypothetical protein n=1 Tax=Modestobacter sp. SSW1-42 TaxID=596372 RepID=UPI0039856F0D
MTKNAIGTHRQTLQRNAARIGRLFTIAVDGGRKQLRGSWLSRDENAAPVFVLEWGAKQVDLSIEDMKTLQELFQHLSWRGVMNLDAAVSNAIADHEAGLPEVAA